MPKNLHLEESLREKARLVIKIHYVSSLFSFLFSGICFYLLNIKHVIPYVFLTFGILNLINVLIYNYHRSLALTYNIVSIMTLTGACIITLYSGGINSPFIFVLVLVIVAGYVTTKAYGNLYLNLNLLIILIIYLQSIADFNFVVNVIPEKSRNVFALISGLFSIYLLGGVFGKNLLHAHNDLYKTKSKLEEKINEKSTLIKEVHHRVKNNLQTISSLLSLQSRNSGDQEVQRFFRSSQNRVISMAMVHKKLYMRQDLTNIDFRSYVQELAEYLIQSVKDTKNDITLEIDIPEVQLNIDTAIPLGLLINETITNSLKFGIQEGGKEKIYIHLQKGDSDEYILLIGDNGIGFSESITHKNSKSLGLKLIHNLVRQLQGTIIRDFSRDGTHYTITFKMARNHSSMTS